MDWSKLEVELIVADYFSMLQDELIGKSYNKAQHRKNLLPLLSNRNDSSIEFKHQNISAVLIEMGLPFIKGYKPRFSYQQLLQQEVSNYLQLNKNNLESNFEVFALNNDTKNIIEGNIDFNNLLTEEPVISVMSEPKEIYRPIKINYLEKEQNNRSLGEKGESFVLAYEKWRLTNCGQHKLANEIEWVSKKLGDGLGYDILSKNIDGTDRFIEVKTTKLTKDTPIFLTKTELQFAKSNSNNFSLYRVFNFNDKPSLFIRNGGYNSFCELKPETFKGYFTN